MQFSVMRNDTKEIEIVNGDELLDACERISESARYPLTVVPVTNSSNAAPTTPAPPPTDVTAETLPAIPASPAIPANSTFTHLVSDDAAKARIEAQHAVLISGGIKVDLTQQLFATGTRMADVGYATQAARKVEHDTKLPARDACAALIDTVRAEGRRDVVMSAREIADSIDVNGHIKIAGHMIGTQAIRGLLARIESPALGYVLGVTDRMRERVRSGIAADAIASANNADRAEIAHVIRHECLSRPGETVKLRLRAKGMHGRPDCYAMTSEGYSPADAPEAVGQIASQLPRDARASWSYDPGTTTWELRAAVWTPTPVAEQAVGEAFEGYVSFQSKDNGTAKFRGGGGVTMLRCLNASTYSADDSSIARVHRGRVCYDVQRMAKKALRAIDILTDAWGLNRSVSLEVPTEFNGRRVTLEDAIPGFYMSLLRGRGSELAGVLPGRTRDHAEGLSKSYWGERRDAEKVTRSDLAQGWTHYIQGQPAEIRRDAEMAIGDWLVNKREVKCDLEMLRR